MYTRHLYKTAELEYVHVSRKLDWVRLQSPNHPPGCVCHITVYKHWRWDGEEDTELSSYHCHSGWRDEYGWYLHLSAMSWERFISSLLTLHQAVCFTLQYTNIDDVTVRRIQNSPRITFTRDDGGGWVWIVYTPVSWELGEIYRSWDRFISSLLTIHQSVCAWN